MIFEFSRLKYTLEVEVKFSQFSVKKSNPGSENLKYETFFGDFWTFLIYYLEVRLEMKQHE